MFRRWQLGHQVGRGIEAEHTRILGCDSVACCARLNGSHSTHCRFSPPCSKMRIESNDGQYLLHPPPAYLSSIVQEGHQWHIPKNDGRWLCIKTPGELGTENEAVFPAGEERHDPR